MSVRRVLVLMHGLGYHMPGTEVEESPAGREESFPIEDIDNRIRPQAGTRAPSSAAMSSKSDMKRFFGGAIRVSPTGEVTDGG